MTLTTSQCSLAPIAIRVAEQGAGSAYASPHTAQEEQISRIEAYGVAHQKRLYGPVGDRVIDEYERLRLAGRRRSEIMAGMAAYITAAGGRRVSKHVADPAALNVIDIAPSSISPHKRRSFEAAVAAEQRVSRFLYPPQDPAYHLEIPQPQCDGEAHA
jgi:hypothetical protein